MRDDLAPGGVVARAWTRFEDRPSQRALAGEVAETIALGGVLVAEAPTGLGKSLAYLVPAVLHAARSGERVVVATCTRSLQDQLFERDLPDVLASLGVSLRVARLKGKQNYVCPSALDLVEGQGAEEEETIDALRGWAAGGGEGDLDRFAAPDAEAFRRVRPRVAADPDACTLPGCRRGRECPWARARREAGEAAIVVVNHALLARAQEVDGLLPDHDVLIVDEAHRLEGVLIGQRARSVSRHRFEEAARLVGAGRGRRTGGLVARLRGYALPLLTGADGGTLEERLDDLARRVGQVRTEAERFFAAAAPRGAGHAVYGVRERYRSAEELLDRDLEPLEVLLQATAGVARALATLAAGWNVTREPGAEALGAELEQVAARWSVLGGDLGRIADASDPGWVYWRTAGGRGVELHAAPVDVGAYARAIVPGRARAAVLTSATLSTGGDVEFFAERLGLGERWGVPYETRIHASPFDLARQTRTFVYDGGDEVSAVTSLIAALAPHGRNMLVLFTAHERLRRAREALLGALPPGRLLLAQEWDGPAGLLAERFRAARGAILLGVQSLWEGVDFPGDALQILIVAKLPFSVPDEPIVEARAERLAARGLDPFRHDAVPEAVLRFRQGVGRLIRRSDDRGVLIVCDPRLATASYRGAFLETLASAPERLRDAAAMAHEVERFLSAERTLEGRV